MDVPACCGQLMNVFVEEMSFMRVHCKRCGDVLFVRKSATEPNALKYSGTAVAFAGRPK